MNILGIDPDLGGGLCFMTIDSEGTLKIQAMRHMPTIKEKKGNRLDTVTAHDWIKHECLHHGIDVVVLEATVTRPSGGKQRAHTGKAHETYGALRAIAETLCRRSTLVIAWPHVWKKKLGLSSDKELSLQKAAEALPTYHRIWAVKKNHGLAEAALMCLWAAQKM